jgi:hypothetical protein
MLCAKRGIEDAKRERVLPSPYPVRERRGEKISAFDAAVIIRGFFAGVTSPRRVVRNALFDVGARGIGGTGGTILLALVVGGTFDIARDGHGALLRDGRSMLRPIDELCDECA